MFLDYENIKKKAELESQLRDIYSHFLINYLLTTKKEVVKITPLTLRINGFPLDLKEFVKQQWTIEYGYIKLIEQEDNYLKVKLTDKSYLMADSFEFEHQIVHRNYLIRFISWGFNLRNKIRTFFLKSVPRFFKQLFSKKNNKTFWKIVGRISVVLGCIWSLIKIIEWAIGKGYL